MDEAGDLTLFDKRGRLIVGNEGVSKVFMVGMAHLANPSEIRKQLDALRTALLGDPYFKGVPSMQAEARKTAFCFHAKDDLPEVRREVFKLIATFGAKVQVAIRRKGELAREARALHRHGMKLKPNSVYDYLVTSLFKRSLHKADENKIVFARRGKSARDLALSEAIGKAKRNFFYKTGIGADRPIGIRPAVPSESGGLQVVDYYLWALQRMYERGEDRFFNLLASDYRLIMDLDDTRNKACGEWYSDSNPLTLKN